MEPLTLKTHLKLKAKWGDDITEFAQRLINTAQASGEKVEGVFNNITLTVLPKSNITADDLVEFFEQEQTREFEEMIRKAEEYRNSPEGIQEAQEAEKKVNLLIKQLTNLDFTNFESVLNWISDFQEPSKQCDKFNVSFDKQKIISLFQQNGFEVGKPNFENLNNVSIEDHARFLVGHALDYMNAIGYLDELIHGSIDNWKEGFNKSKQETVEIDTIRNSL